MKIFSVFVILFSVLYACTPKDIPNYCQYVDPFIGTVYNGHTFPGATTPFGFIQASPETGNDAWKYCSGYTTPQIPKIELELPEDKTFVMEAPNLSTENKYVQSVELNGEIYTGKSISHKDIMNGGRLVFTMTGKQKIEQMQN
jgi:putative alpha-1,2-mannosidase